MLCKYTSIIAKHFKSLW